jgi:hypothetical protein
MSMVENLVYLLENFASGSAPLNPQVGQLWYDRNSNILKVLNSSNTWVGTGRVLVDNSTPDVTLNVPGQLWYQPLKGQLFVYDSSPSINDYVLVAPLGAADSSNPDIAKIRAPTSTDVVTITDTGRTPATHQVIAFTVNGKLLALFSSDPVFSTALPGFAQVSPGLNLSTERSLVSNINGNAGINLNGKSATSGVADSAMTLNGVSSNLFMRLDQTNLPQVDGTGNPLYDLGSSTLKYRAMYANQFHGLATSALYADVAERYHADQPLEPGTVVSLGGINEITRSPIQGCTDVLGVISTRPAVMMNSAAGDDLTHPYVALLGRVPVQVVGTVSRGERLMASALPGVAQRWEPYYGTLAILGRSLENKTSHELGTLEAVIGNR